MEQLQADPNPVSPSVPEAQPPAIDAPTPAEAPAFPDLTGVEVTARVTGRVGRDALFKFQVDGREYRGLPAEELRARFQKSITSGSQFPLRVSGPPDDKGRYPLSEREEEYED